MVRQETKPKYADVCQTIAKFFQNLEVEVYTDAYLHSVQPVPQTLQNKESSDKLVQTLNKMPNGRNNKKYNQPHPPVVEVVTFFKYLWNEWKTMAYFPTQIFIK